MAVGVGSLQDEGLKINTDRENKGNLIAGTTDQFEPGITLEEFDTYQQKVEQQAALTPASIVAFNVGAVTAALGVLLYYFDEPKPPTIKPKKDDANPTKKDSSPGMRDMMFAPMVAPGFGGAAFSAKF